MNKGDDCIRDAAPSPPRPSPGPSPAPTPPAPPAPPSPPVAPPLGFKPNILFMLADDFGHYNVGWRNKEARTPNMDGLVANGLVLDRHYGEGARLLLGVSFKEEGTGREDWGEHGEGGLG